MIDKITFFDSYATKFSVIIDSGPDDSVEDEEMIHIKLSKESGNDIYLKEEDCIGFIKALNLILEDIKLEKKIEEKLQEETHLIQHDKSMV